MASVFETKTCSRCGGSGHYSYCQRFGTTCFGCGGTGTQYTKRGAAARRFYQDSLKVRLDSLVVGDLMQIESFGAESSYTYFAPIVEIKPYRMRGSSLKDGVMVPFDYMSTEVTTEHPKHGRAGLVSQGDHMIRKGWSASDKTAARAAALEYQATLTQAGTVRRKA